MVEEHEIPPNTPDLWKNEVDFLRKVMFARCVSLTEKIQALGIDYEIPEPIIASLYNDIGFIAGLLQNDYGFDGTVN